MNIPLPYSSNSSIGHMCPIPKIHSFSHNAEGAVDASEDATDSTKIHQIHEIYDSSYNVVHNANTMTNILNVFISNFNKLYKIVGSHLQTKCHKLEEISSKLHEAKNYASDASITKSTSEQLKNNTESLKMNKEVYKEIMDFLKEKDNLVTTSLNMSNLGVKQTLDLSKYASKSLIEASVASKIAGSGSLQKLTGNHINRVPSSRNASALPDAVILSKLGYTDQFYDASITADKAAEHAHIANYYATHARADAGNILSTSQAYKADPLYQQLPKSLTHLKEAEYFSNRALNIAKSNPNATRDIVLNSLYAKNDLFQAEKVIQSFLKMLKTNGLNPEKHIYDKTIELLKDSSHLLKQSIDMRNYADETMHNVDAQNAIKIEKETEQSLVQKY